MALFQYEKVVAIHNDTFEITSPVLDMVKFAKMWFPITLNGEYMVIYTQKSEEEMARCTRSFVNTKEEQRFGISSFTQTNDTIWTLDVIRLK